MFSYSAPYDRSDLIFEPLYPQGADMVRVLVREDVGLLIGVDLREEAPSPSPAAASGSTASGPSHWHPSHSRIHRSSPGTLDHHNRRCLHDPVENYSHHTRRYCVDFPGTPRICLEATEARPSSRGRRHSYRQHTKPARPDGARTTDRRSGRPSGTERDTGPRL